MIKSDFEEFTLLLKDLGEILEGNLSPRKIELYFNALMDIEMIDVRRAANNIARTATFFPKPSEFRNGVVGDKDTLVVIAWEKVQRGKQEAGSYQSIQFDDPLIHSVINLMGGWVAVCRLEGHDDEKWQRLEFEKTYKALYGQKKDHPSRLVGGHEASNAARGFTIDPNIVMIGNSDRKAIE